MFTFVTGGLRSGKSDYALRRASELGPPPWLYVAAHIEGVEALRAAVADYTLDYVEARSGVPAALVVRAARLFAAGRRGSAMTCTGVNMAPRPASPFAGRARRVTHGGRDPRADVFLVRPSPLTPPPPRTTPQSRRAPGER